METAQKWQEATIEKYQSCIDLKQFQLNFMHSKINSHKCKSTISVSFLQLNLWMMHFLCKAKCKNHPGPKQNECQLSTLNHIKQP